MIAVAFIVAILAIAIVHVMALRRAVREHHELLALVWSEAEDGQEAGRA
jgi:hypothetical protein